MVNYCLKITDKVEKAMTLESATEVQVSIFPLPLAVHFPILENEGNTTFPSKLF